MCPNASHGVLESCPNQWTMEGQMFLVFIYCNYSSLHKLIFNWARDEKGRLTLQL